MVLELAHRVLEGANSGPWWPTGSYRGPRGTADIIVGPNKHTGLRVGPSGPKGPKCLRVCPQGP